MEYFYGVSIAVLYKSVNKKKYLLLIMMNECFVVIRGEFVYTKTEVNEKL